MVSIDPNSPPSRPSQVGTAKANSGLIPLNRKQMMAWGQLFIELIIAQVAMALGNISVLGTHPLSFLTTWGQNLEQQSSQAYVQSQSAQASADTANTNNQNTLDVLTGNPSGSGIGTLTDLAGKVQDWLSGGGPFPASEIIGLLSPAQLPLIGTGSIGNIVPNLLANPFNLGDPASWLDGQGIWTPDSTVTHLLDASGNPIGQSFTALLDGTQKDIFSDPALPVAPGDVVNLNQWITWANAVGLGDVFQLAVNAYSSADGTGSIVESVPLATITNPAAAPADWTQLAGTYTVPDGVNSIRTRLSVLANGTAGQVWVHDGAQLKPQLIPKGSIDGLLAQLTHLDPTGLLDATGITNWESIVEGIVPFAGVQGIQGIPHLGGSLQSTVDQLASAYHPTGSVVDATLSYLATLAQQTRADASDAHALSSTNTDALAFRNNKPAWSGLQSTVESNIPLSAIIAGSAPPASVAATAANAPMGLMRTAGADSKGFVQWLGSGNANITSFVVNVYKLDPTTNDLVWLHTSPDMHTNLPASGWAYLTYTFSGANQTAVQAGDVLAAEFIVTGTGTHNIAGLPASYAPAHPTSKLKHLMASRNPATLGAAPARIPAANISWTGAIPYVGFGITNVPANYQPPTPAQITATGLTVVNIPAWANFVDLAGILGSGAGGNCGDGGGGGTGNGGGAGGWAPGRTLQRGVDFPANATQLSVYVGVPGAAGVGGNNNANLLGHDGEASYAQWVDVNGVTQTYSGPAGLHNPTTFGSDNTGKSPGNHDYNGTTYFGGQAVGTNAAGNPPGGGGGGGTGGFYGSYHNGMPGARGEANLVFRQS